MRTISVRLWSRALVVLAAALSCAPDALALDLPSSSSPDPLNLRSCAVGLFGSVAAQCELLDLQGAVKQVAYLEDGKVYETFELNRRGRVSARRTKLLSGGWKDFRLHYGLEGQLAETTVNGLSGTEYRYEAGQLSESIHRRDKERCAYVRQINVPGSQRIEVSCSRRNAQAKFSADLDDQGRLLALDAAGGDAWGLTGPVTCRHAALPGGQSSACSDAASTYQMNYDPRGRLQTVRKSAREGGDTFEAEFSYTDDAAGNWVVQNTRLTETFDGNTVAQSYQRTREVEYHAPAGPEEQPEDVRLTPKAEGILRGALDPAGVLDKSLYDGFWNEIPVSVRESAANRAWLGEEVFRKGAGALQFQRELWASLKQSVAQKREVRTEGYSKLKGELTLRPNGPANSARIIEDAERMIAAAASGKPIRTPRGAFSITHQRVETVAAGLEDGWSRLQRLMAPEWTEAVRHYDDAHLILASVTAYQRTIGRELVGDTLFSFILYRGPSEEGRVPTIGYIEAPGLNPTDAAMKALGYRLFKLNLFNTLDGPMQWRGRRAHVFSTLDRGRPGEPHQSILFIPDPARSGLWVVAASSERSFMAAKTLREHLEKNLALK